MDVSARLTDGVVEVAVSDTGSGISPDDLDLIFEEFELQAYHPHRRNGSRPDLSRKFVELHGGRLWVESVVGAGSTFRFTLPTERGGGARWLTS